MWLEFGLPAAKPLVLFGGDDHGVIGVVDAAGDLAFEGFLIGSFEVAERVRALSADRLVPILSGSDRVLALGLNAGEFEFLAQHIGQFGNRDFDLANVLTGVAPRLSLAVGILSGAEWLADFAVSLSGPAGAFVAVDKVGDVDAGDGDADGFSPFAAEHLAMVDVLLEVLADLAADDLVKSLQVPIDSACHGSNLLLVFFPESRFWRRPIPRV